VALEAETVEVTVALVVVVQAVVVPMVAAVRLALVAYFFTTKRGL
jgi:hypothetical protein